VKQFKQPSLRDAFSFVWQRGDQSITAAATPERRIAAAGPTLNLCDAAPPVLLMLVGERAADELALVVVTGAVPLDFAAVLVPVAVPLEEKGFQFFFCFSD